jgi:hypothetical protein
MGKIDTSGWKEFKLGYIMVGNKKQGHGLFEIVNSVAYHGKDVTETDSDDGINYITRSKFNNGLKARVVRLDKFKVNPAGTISFGAENADFFYQTEPYITGNKMYYIDTTALSERACRFLKSILEATFTANYSFSDGMIPARIYDECIKLPATPDGAPDWSYMESYMANLESKVAESLTLLQAAKDAEKKKVDTREWGEFRVGELFDIHPTKAYKCTNAELLDNGETHVVVNSAYNNGVGGLSTLKPTEQGNMITFSDTVDANTIFYQDKPFIGYPHVQGLYPIGIFRKNWTELSLKYFATVFRQKALSIGFDYGNKFRRDIAVKLYIFLPVDKTGQPDWWYMEEYMRKVEEKAKNVLNHFEKDRNGV